MLTSRTVQALLVLTLLSACADEKPNKEPADGGTVSSAPSDAATEGDAQVAVECFGEALPARAVASLQRPPLPAGLEPYAKSAGLRQVEPTAAGMTAAGVEAALSFTVPRAVTEALLIVRHGYIVGERYFGSFSQTQTHESYSMAKSVTSALIGIAIDENKLSGTDEKLCPYYADQWRCDDPADLHGAITIDHAMNIRTGIQWQEDWRSISAPNDALRGDILNLALSRPVVDAPGSHLRYSTGDPALLSAVVQKATGRSVLAYANEKLFGPLGIDTVAWAADAAGRTNAYANLSLTARDYAKFGLLYAQDGEWDGKRVVPADWVARTTQPEDRCTEQYRYLWHINPPIRLGTPDPDCAEIIGCRPTKLAELPGDIFFAEGAFGQGIYIIPSQDIVAVRLAMDPLDSALWDEVSRTFLSLILDAVAP